MNDKFIISDPDHESMKAHLISYFDLRPSEAENLIIRILSILADDRESLEDSE